MRQIDNKTIYSDGDQVEFYLNDPALTYTGVIIGVTDFRCNTTRPQGIRYKIQETGTLAETIIITEDRIVRLVI